MQSGLQFVQRNLLDSVLLVLESIPESPLGMIPELIPEETVQDLLVEEGS